MLSKETTVSEGRTPNQEMCNDSSGSTPVRRSLPGGFAQVPSGRKASHLAPDGGSPLGRGARDSEDLDVNDLILGGVSDLHELQGLGLATVDINRYIANKKFDVGSARAGFQVSRTYTGTNSLSSTHKDEFKYSKCYIHPEHCFRITWDALSMVLILMLIVTVPLELSFRFEKEDDGDFFNYINDLSDIWFACDMVFNCFTAYYSGKGASRTLQTHPRQILKNYSRGWLWIDLMATTPVTSIFKLFAGAGGDGTQGLGMLRALKVAKVARMLKVLRALKLGGLMQLVEEQIVTVQSMTLAFQLLKLSVIMLLSSHCAACAWFAVGFWGGLFFEMTWLVAQDLTDANMTDQYVAASTSASPQGPPSATGTSARRTRPSACSGVFFLWARCATSDMCLLG